MKTLKDAWLYLLNKILYSETSCQVEDYIECVNETVTFSLDKDIYELKGNEKIFLDYSEMHKVFFSEDENIFGHSYKTAIIGPIPNQKDPINSIVTLLRKNPTTRKAILTFIPYGTEKVPCITSIQFLIRNNQLNLIYNSRGQDIFRKFPCDAMCIAEFGFKVIDELKLNPGIISANIASAHIYNHDIENAKILISKKNNVILTGNALKYQPLLNLLEANNIELLVKKMDLPEIQSLNILDVAKSKAKIAYEQLGKSVWIDDVSLLSEAIPHFPGAYTKDIFKIFEISDLKEIFKNKSKKASLICTLCQYDGKDFSIIQGFVDGELDFDNEIEDVRMPLNSVFKTKDLKSHRQYAIENLIKFIKGS